MISISIDLNLISEKRCKIQKRRNGAMGKFCNLILIETPGGQYGDYMVKEQTTPEERHAKLDLPILGNGKNLQKGERSQKESEPCSEPTEPDDVPF
jgi:hypothetical protein